MNKCFLKGKLWIIQSCVIRIHRFTVVDFDGLAHAEGEIDSINSLSAPNSRKPYPPPHTLRVFLLYFLMLVEVPISWLWLQIMHIQSHCNWMSRPALGPVHKNWKWWPQTWAHSFPYCPQRMSPGAGLPGEVSSLWCDSVYYFFIKLQDF